MGEIQRPTWVLSRPICSTINYLLMSLFNIHLKTSEEHKEMHASRIKRDNLDINILINYLRSHSPFIEGNKILFNIASGVSSVAGVNVDEAKRIGIEIISKMTGMSVAQFTPKKKGQCVLMNKKINPCATKKICTLDFNLLFQRLIIVLTSKKAEKELSEYFKYELCSLPLSLFENNGNLRSCQKSELAKDLATRAIYDPLNEEINVVTGKEKKSFVIDGGWLLHRLNWTKNETYSNIFLNYCEYVLTNYGKGTIVFYGVRRLRHSINQRYDSSKEIKSSGAGNCLYK